MSDEVTEFGSGDGAKIVQKSESTRPPDDAPQAIVQESWAGIYVDPFQQDIHILLDHSYYGSGGFAGDIPISGSGNGKITYMVPMATELNFRNRVKQTVYRGDFGRFIDSQVSPIFAQARIATTVYLGDTLVENDKDVVRWMKDCTGNGKSYNSMQQFALTELRVHDVAYHAMTKGEGQDLPSLSEYRAIDMIMAVSDVNGALESIMFYKGCKVVEEVEYVTAIQFYMSNGTCKIQRHYAEVGNGTGNWCGVVGKWDDVEWKNDGPEKDTEIDEMVVFPQLPVATADGEWKPLIPRSRRVAMACLGIYQERGKNGWLYALHNLPTPVMWGDIKGILIGAGQMIAQDSTDPNNGYPPAPMYMSPDSSLLTVSDKHIEDSIAHMRDIAKENGVDSKSGSQAQSGDSKRYDFQATEQKLGGGVEMCRTMDEWVFPMFDKYTNRTEGQYTYTRNYPVSFYPEEEATIDDMLEIVGKLSEFEMVEARNAIALRMVKKALGRDVDEDDMKEITKAIENNTVNNSLAE
ncbi:MAG: hypothetical protein GY799_00460 [Desulfobulbaceae bacterium]|nr:hypothetical protein [Desulfobulbaceae bacterium]